MIQISVNETDFVSLLSHVYHVTLESRYNAYCFTLISWESIIV